MAEQAVAPKKKYKVKTPLMAFSGEGDKRSFRRREPGQHVELTDAEAKAAAHAIEPIEPAADPPDQD